MNYAKYNRKSCKECIIDALKYGDKLTYEQIKERTNYSRTTIIRNLKKLINSNMIVREKCPGYYLYSKVDYNS